MSSFDVVDIRNVEVDASPCGNGTLNIRRGIEVGHIFQLGDKYSSAMNCGVLTETGKHETMTMGCYGIGVSRIVAAPLSKIMTSTVSSGLTPSRHLKLLLCQ